jgi:hypothetical protein
VDHLGVVAKLGPEHTRWLGFQTVVTGQVDNDSCAFGGHGHFQLAGGPPYRGVCAQFLRRLPDDPGVQTVDEGQEVEA